MLEGQLCPVWVEERFPEELMVADELGRCFPGQETDFSQLLGDLVAHKEATI